MNTIKGLSLAAALAALLVSGASPGIADDAHHPKDAPKTAEPTPEPKPMGAGQGTMGGDMMGKMMQGGGMMGMMANCPMMGGGQKTADAMKTELGITDAQKPVWEGFAAAQTKAHAGMQDMQQSMKKMMEAKSPVERLDARLGAMEKHLIALKELKPPLAALYASLSDEQKRKAETALAGVGCMM